MKKFKVGRNTPCPCGSGKKFKKCCGSVMARAQNENVRVPDAEYMQNMLRQIEAREKQRIDQQGYSNILSQKRNVFEFKNVYSLQE